MTEGSQRLLRVVSLASRRGRYGGPFDTSVAQCRLYKSLGLVVTLMAGHMKDDKPSPSASGVRFVMVPVRRQLPRTGFVALLSFRWVLALWREVGASDLVHISFSREAMPLLAALVCRLRGRPWICQPHGMLTTRSSRAHSVLDWIVVRPLFRTANVVICLTSVEESELNGWVGRTRQCAEMRVIGNPVVTDVVRELALPAARQEVFFIARLHPRKRVADFCDAAAVASRCGWAGRYVVVGPDEGDVGVVQESARQGHVQYRGAVDSAAVATLIAGAGVFVLCSEREPWGNVLVQCLAAGVPVVLTASSALASEVERWGAGVVVPDRRPEAIAQAVDLILGDERRRDSLKRGAEEFTHKSLDSRAVRGRLAEAVRTATA